MTAFIGTPGYYGDRIYKGRDPQAMQDDVALRVRVPDGQLVKFGHVKIRDCGMPLRHDSGILLFDTLDAKRFTADLFNSPGNLIINNLVVHYYNPDFKYSDELHVDSLGQFFNYITRVVRNVRIHNIKAVIHGPKVQGFGFTEDHRVTDVHIGTGNVSIKMEYKYGLFANTMDKSFVNVGNNGVKILVRKPTIHKTYDVEVKTYPGQLLVFDEGLIDEGKVIMTPVRNTKIALSAGHDRFRMHGAARGGIHENGFWNEFLDDLMPLISDIPGIEVKRFHRPDQKPIGYSEAMRRLHGAIDGWGADVDIDLHFNAGGPSAKGHEVLYHTKSRGGRLAANIVDKAFDEYLNNRDRNRKPVPVGGRGSYGLRVGRSTSLITEAFFAKELPQFVRGGSQRDNLIQAYVAAIKDIANVDSQTAQVTQRTNETLTDDEINAAMALLA